MSEEKNVITEETVSENVVKETPNPDQIGELIAESKKYRKRSQEAEARYAELESKIAKQKENELKEKEEYKTLYEKASSELESLSSKAEQWNRYEESRRTSLLERLPEERRELYSKLPLDTLESVVDDIVQSNVKPNAPEVVGKARENLPSKPYAKMTDEERRANWNNIVKSFNNNKI